MIIIQAMCLVCLLLIINVLTYKYGEVVGYERGLKQAQSLLEEDD